MAVFNEPNQWEHPLGNNADTSTLPDDAAATAGIASLQKLFQIINATPLEAGGIAPDREDVNALFKYLGDQIFYTQNGGIPSYNAAYDYIVGRVVSYNDNLYKCIQANGVSSTVVAPDSDTAYWQRIDNFVRSVNGVNADTQGNVQLDGLVRSVNGINADAQGNVSLDISANIPDYANGIDITSVLQKSPYAYTVPADGVIQFYCEQNTGWKVNINDSTEAYGKNTLMHLNNESGVGTSSYLIVEKGFVVRCTTEHDAQFAMFYPFK